MPSDGRRQSGPRGIRAGLPPDPRFSLANERTFLAWNRTALALVAAGLAIAQLVDVGGRDVELSIGLGLIVLGAAVSVAGFGRWRGAQTSLRRRTPLPRSRLAPSLLCIGLTATALASVLELASAALS